MRSATLARLAFGLVTLGSAVFFACGGDATEATGDTSDGGVVLDASPDPLTDAAPQQDAAIPPKDAAPDVVVNSGPFASCKAALAANPGSPSGKYPIDVDGAGPLAALNLYCEMTFAGGGWTLIFSTVDGNTLEDPGDHGTDAGLETGYYHREPAPGQLGALAPEWAKALAANALEAHIRSPFATPTDAGEAGWVTSVVPGDGGPSHAIANLRDGLILNARGESSYDGKWTGPNATASFLGYDESPGSGCDPVTTAEYPQLYWACNNSLGLHLSAGASRWVYESFQDEPIEVYVR